MTNLIKKDVHEPWVVVALALGTLLSACTSGDTPAGGRPGDPGTPGDTEPAPRAETPRLTESSESAAGPDPEPQPSVARLRFRSQPAEVNGAGQGSAAPASARLKLVWLSLDGLQRQMIEGFLSRSKVTHPFGLRSLLAGGAGRRVTWEPVEVVDPTITSASHASTITCSPPGVHGIVSNGQWNGAAMESGFDKPYAAETFVHALRQKGLRVGVVGYPGFDGQTSNRTADSSVSYDSAPDRSQLISLKEKPKGELHWLSRLAPDVGNRISISYELDTASQQVRVITREGLAGDVTENGWLNVLGLVGERSQQVSLTLFRKDDGLYLYLSPTSVNRVLPVELEKAFERKGMVFSAGKDYGLRAALGDQAFLRTMGHRLFSFMESMHSVLDDDSNDALFLYFEDLDVLGHQYAGISEALPLIDAHLAQFDKALGSVLSRLPSGANVVVVGDHGMSAVQYELNPIAFLPASARDELVVRSSGGSLFLYGKGPSSLTSAPPRDAPWFRELVSKLETLRVPGDQSKRLFPRVIVRGSPSARSAGWQDETALPWIMAFAEPGVGIKTVADERLVVSKRAGFTLPKDVLMAGVQPGHDAQELPEPVPAGQHGHISSSPDMLTHVAFWGPAFSKSGLRRKSDAGAPLANTVLVPRVADALGWPRPESCRK